MKKGVECVYDRAATEGKRAVPTSSSGASHENDMSTSRALNAHESFLYDPEDVILSNANVDSANHLILDGTLLQPVDNHPPVDLGAQAYFLNESQTLDELLEFDDYTSGQLQNASDVSVALYNKLDPQLPSWCTWTRGGFSVSLVTETSVVGVDSNILTILQRERPHALHSVNLIIQSLRSFPTMMLRRETFPWFIHPQSHLLSKPAKAALPESLSTCMSIAQLFALRTSETKYFLWCSIRTEYRRFTNEKQHMSIFELLAALQACMIYLIMCIVEQSPQSEEASLELLIVLQDLYFLAKHTTIAPINYGDLSNPRSSWEDWIFAESQRRLANLWFLIGCVICVKTGLVCDASQSYRTLLLPSPKSLWEAPTQSAWESEYEASRILQTSGLVTLGDLIDVQQSDFLPSNAQKLDKWNAGVDNLGTLLNLVSTMI